MHNQKLQSQFEVLSQLVDGDRHELKALVDKVIHSGHGQLTAQFAMQDSLSSTIKDTVAEYEDRLLETREEIESLKRANAELEYAPQYMGAEIEALRKSLRQTQKQMQVSVEQRGAAMQMLRVAQKQLMKERDRTEESLLTARQNAQMDLSKLKERHSHDLNALRLGCDVANGELAAEKGKVVDVRAELEREKRKVARLEGMLKSRGKRDRALERSLRFEDGLSFEDLARGGHGEDTTAAPLTSPVATKTNSSSSLQSSSANIGMLWACLYTRCPYVFFLFVFIYVHIYIYIYIYIYICIHTCTCTSVVYRCSMYVSPLHANICICTHMHAILQLRNSWHSFMGGIFS
jgi:hypothetical protein